VRLHKAYVDGYPSAIALARRVTTEGAKELGSAYFLLQRLPEGNFRLLAYARAAGDRMETYVFDQPGRKDSRPITVAAGSASTPHEYSFPGDVERGSILVALAR
jgi:hypothetical protein